MAQQTERQTKITWMAVPEFGAWDQTNSEAMDYSVIFNQARTNRKQHKSDVTRNLGNDREFIVTSFPPKHKEQPQPDQDLVSRRKKLLTYIKSCIKP